MAFRKARRTPEPSSLEISSQKLMACAWTTSSQQILIFGLYSVQLLKNVLNYLLKIKSQEIFTLQRNLNFGSFTEKSKFWHHWPGFPRGNWSCVAFVASRTHIPFVGVRKRHAFRHMSCKLASSESPHVIALPQLPPPA